MWLIVICRLPPSELKIRLGSSYNGKEGIVITEKLQVILHSKYDKHTQDYDAALIKVCLWFFFPVLHLELSRNIMQLNVMLLYNII